MRERTNENLAALFVACEMADVEVCVFCGNLLSTDAVDEVKKKGLETIKACSLR